LEGELRREGWKVQTVPVVAGDQAKDYRRAMSLTTRLVESRLDRQSVVLALGGGVIGDLAGFVAGTYLRGVRWVGLPSTLLAQVDSSIGGKTGVNHPLGKNLIGVFHQPSMVICDTALLGTLDMRDRVSGFAEMVKYGLIYDRRYFHQLVRHWRDVVGLDSTVLTAAIVRAARFKASVVAKDERETAGLRVCLNFGHTVGHAIEAATRYRYRHGEALVVGMRVAAALSFVRGHLPAQEADEIDRFLKILPVPRIGSGVDLGQLFPYVQRDKKGRRGKVAFVLLQSIGETVLDDGVTRAHLAAAFRKVGIPT
jgi:3-dehydroquinate synthase